MPRLPDRLLPSHLGAGAQSKRANRGWSPPLAAGAGSAGRGFPRWPRCRSLSAARAPAVRPPRARALQSSSLRAPGFPQGCNGTALAGGAGKRGCAHDHVTGANMAAPIGVHLLARRGKHLEGSAAGVRNVAHSLCTRVQRYRLSRADIAEHATVLSVRRVHGSTHGDTLTPRRQTKHLLVTCVVSIRSRSSRFMGHCLKFLPLPELNNMFSVPNLFIPAAGQ